jgi:acetyl esterase/lipase
MTGVRVKAIASAVAVLFSAVAAAQVTVENNVRYATHDGVPLAGDLYLPSTAGPHPAVMFIHGGAWKVGSKSGYASSWGPYLAERGYVVFSIDYRLSTPATPTWPKALLDCKAALQYLRGNAAALGVDPDRIAAGGDSAGGELSAMLALTQDWPAFAERYPDDPFAGVSTKVKAVIPAYAVFNMAAWWRWTKIGYPTTALEYTSLDELFGGAPSDVPGAYLEASPLEYVRQGATSLGALALANDGLDAAWFVTYGLEDPIVPADDQSIPFAKALRDAGADVTEVAVPNIGHFWFSKSALTGRRGMSPSCTIAPGNFVVCPGATPNDYIAPRLLEFLAKNL